MFSENDISVFNSFPGDWRLKMLLKWRFYLYIVIGVICTVGFEVNSYLGGMLSYLSTFISYVGSY